MMNIRILYFDGCPNHPPAVDLVHDVVSDLGVDATVEAVEVTASSDVDDLRFLGSPTLQINGIDVEPDARSRTNFGYSCRTYSGGAGLPDRAIVVAAINEARSGHTAQQRSAVGSSIGSILAAIGASACCWVPLIAITFGVSAGGAAAVLDQWRPWLIGIALVLLGFGFYSVYFRRDRCAADASDCCPPGRNTPGVFNQIMLWTSTAMVTALIFLPLWGPTLLITDDAAAATVSVDSSDTVTIGVDGMTCAMCAAHITRELLTVDGVLSAEASYEQGRATVIVDAAAPPKHEALTAAITQAGYTVQTTADTDGATAPVANDASPVANLIPLTDEVTAFRDQFNQRADRARFVTLLSSTCGPCVSGAVTTNEAIVRGFPDADIDISVVWIDVLPGDNAASAARASMIFDDPRVTQFHDPNQHLGAAFAKGLLSKPPAWDIYLFYPPEDRWVDTPPKPLDWMHQLGGQDADPDRYLIEARLAAQMHKTMQALGYVTDRPAPDGEQLAAARSAATAKIGQAACGSDGGAEAQCARCAEAGTIGQCAVSGWRYIVATMVLDDNGAPTDRFEMAGAPSGPVDLGKVRPTDHRHDFTIEGMTCPDCAVQVAGRALQGRGVVRVEVDYDQRHMILYTASDSGNTLDPLRMHLELAGYRMLPMDTPAVDN